MVWNHNWPTRANLAYNAVRGVGYAYGKRKYIAAGLGAGATAAGGYGAYRFASKRNRYRPPARRGTKGGTRFRSSARRFVPIRKKCSFRYVETVSLDVASNSAGASSVQKLIYPQQIVDALNHNNNSHQPRQYDAAMSVYDRCTVIGAKITVRHLSGGSGVTEQVPVYWGMKLDNTAYERYDLAGEDLDNIVEMTGRKRMRVTGRSDNRGPGFHSKDVQVFKYCAKKFYKTKSLFANPGNPAAETGYWCGSHYTSDQGEQVGYPVIKLWACAAKKTLTSSEQDPVIHNFQVIIDWITVLTQRNPFDKDS